jgi:hypothetical protein
VDARPTARGRKPSGADDASDVGSIKKRGRKPKAIEADAGGDGMDIDEPARKNRRDLATSASTTSHSARPRPSLDDATADDELPVGDMKKWMTIKSWEHIVSVIDTVERHDDGGLEVYFRLYVFFCLNVLPPNPRGSAGIPVKRSRKDRSSALNDSRRRSMPFHSSAHSSR